MTWRGSSWHCATVSNWPQAAAAPGKKGLRREGEKELPLVDQEDPTRTEWVLLVLTLAIYTEYSTRASHISKKLIMYLIPLSCHTPVDYHVSIYVHHTNVPMLPVYLTSSQRRHYKLPQPSVNNSHWLLMHKDLSRAIHDSYMNWGYNK